MYVKVFVFIVFLKILEMSLKRRNVVISGVRMGEVWATSNS